MKPKEKQEMLSELSGFKLVKHKISWEGFDYCFRFYSDFKNDIKDEKFHELRKGYLSKKVKAEELEFYIITKIKELSEEYPDTF